MKEIDVEGKSVQEAVSIALKKLHAKREEVEVKVLNEETKGLFGMEGARPAKVRIIMKRKR